MGIGLAVVKRIVDEHGWHIEVESSEGRGATFRVRMTGA
jgi:signal transduction histidine kinase